MPVVTQTVAYPIQYAELIVDMPVVTQTVAYPIQYAELIVDMPVVTQTVATPIQWPREPRVLHMACGGGAAVDQKREGSRRGARRRRGVQEKHFVQARSNTRSCVGNANQTDTSGSFTFLCCSFAERV